MADQINQFLMPFSLCVLHLCVLVSLILPCETSFEEAEASSTPAAVARGNRNARADPNAVEADMVVFLDDAATRDIVNQLQVLAMQREGKH